MDGTTLMLTTVIPLVAFIAYGTGEAVKAGFKWWVGALASTGLILLVIGSIAFMSRMGY